MRAQGDSLVIIELNSIVNSFVEFLLLPGIKFKAIFVSVFFINNWFGFYNSYSELILTYSNSPFALNRVMRSPVNIIPT